MKVYIAGKITGNGEYREEFAAAERKVSAMGHIALNPAALPEGMEPADYMRICMAMLDSADAIAIMENWTESTGARIEFAYAQYVHKKVLKLWLMPESPAAADKDGRVVVLPCKVGDRVFVLVGYDKQIKECTVTYMYDNWALLQSIDNPEKEYGTSFVDFGKRTFFNRAEAEEAKKI